MNWNRMGKTSVWALLVSAVSLTGCGKDTGTADGADSADDADGAGGHGGAGGAGAAPGPLYGVGTMTTGDEGTSDYLLLVPKLDHGGDELTLESAREFPGQSDLSMFGEYVLASSGDEPTIVKYEVKADNSLEEVDRVGFASFGLASAAFWNNQFVGEDKAYMVNGVSELIVWNPTTMEIEGSIELPELEARDGLRVVAGLADRSSLVQGGKFYLPLYWTDDSYAERSDDSVILVVDVATDTVEGTISADCPGLDYATVDDEGTLYFSNWTGGVGTHYVLGTAANCIAAVDPATEEVTTTSFASITDGHEGAAFEYAGDGLFVLSVFDEVRADIENAEDPFTPVGGLNWQLWSYDPATGDAAPIEDIDWNSGAIIHAPIGDAFYSMIPGADYATTEVYKVDGTSAEPAFGITGWSFRLFQVR